MTEGRCLHCLTLQDWSPGIDDVCDHCGLSKKEPHDLSALPEPVREARQKWSRFSAENKSERDAAEFREEFAFYSDQVDLAEAFLHDLWEIAREHLDPQLQTTPTP